MAVIDELLVGLGFEYDPKDLDEFNESIESTTQSITRFAKVVVAGSAALLGFTAATTAATDRQGKLAKQTGVSVEEIDALEFALKRAGGQGEAMGTSLEQLSIRISETSRGIGSGIEAFGILGISVTDTNGQLKSTEQILLEVSDSLQRFSKAEQIELADKLGLRDSILLLQEGSDGIRELTNEARALGVTTREDAALSEQFQDSLTNIFQVIKQISRVLTRSLVPILQEAGEGVEDWWKANREVIEQNLPQFINKAAIAIKLLTLAAISFIAVKLITTIGTLITLFTTLGARAVFLNAAIFAIPALIAAVAAAFVLLLEDAKVFFEGGESFIGSMLEKYPEWKDEILAVASVLKGIVDIVSMIFDGWSMIFDLFAAEDPIGDLRLAINQFQKDTERAFNELVDRIGRFFSELWDQVVQGFNDNVIAPIMERINAIKEFLGIDDEIDINVNANIEQPDLSSIVLNNQGLEINANTGQLVNLPEELDLASVVLTDLGERVANDSVLNGLAADIGQPSPLGGLTENDIQTTNNNQANSVNFELGNINVQVETANSDPQTSGKIIGERIREELEPLFKQASRDLNSAVTI